MDNQLDAVLQHISEAFQAEILPGSRNYREVDIGKRAKMLGFMDVAKTYNAINAVVPIKEPVEGMKVMVDGRTFVNYRQYDSGMVVPGYVAEASNLPHRPFVANDSMVLNF
jgi:hypothetical protein